ncbi:MAG: glycosyltransferase family 39 protein [Candidatus Omnitrophota bacterium]
MFLKYLRNIFTGKKNSRKILLIIFLVYGFSMVGYGIAKGFLNNDRLLPGDQLVYRVTGGNLARGLGYTFDGKTPHGIYQIGYPIFLGALFKIFGHKIVPVVITQYVLGIANFFLFLQIVRLIVASEPVRYISIFLYFTNHIIVYFPSLILSETLGIFLFFLFLLFSLRYFISYKKRHIFIASIFFGCLILVRNKFQLLPLFFLLASLITHRKYFFKEAVLFFLVSVIIISPVLIRNKNAFGQYKLSFHGGNFFYLGMKCSTKEKLHKTNKEAIPTLAQEDSEYFKLFFEDIYRHPLRATKNYIGNFVRLNFPLRALDSKKHISFLRRLVTVKNIFLFLGIGWCLVVKKRFLFLGKRIDFVFLSLLFLYDNFVSSFGLTGDMRLGLYSHILLYFIFVLSIESCLEMHNIRSIKSKNIR